MIRFPKLSIAASVVNRILNVHDEIQAGRVAPSPAAGPPNEPPALADTQATGQAIDQTVYAPQQPVSTDDPSLQDAITLKGVL